MNCIHLDFHTSPDIDGIGESFDKEAFTEMLKRSGIDLMTVFAKCHHGYTYYPSKVGTMHPGLKFDLLREQIDAIHAAGAKAPIYITMGWSKKDADEHPEWHHIDFKTGRAFGADKIPSDPEAPLPDCSWVTLCPVGGYLDYMERITREVCERYDPSDGIFYDICFMQRACGCDSCKRGMAQMGLDPESYEDACKYYSLKRVEMMKRLNAVVHEYAPEAPVFYNGGADMNRTEYHPYQSHYELEDLPTAWGGYDLMPIRAKFFERYGKRFIGMTGKFHHAWGEFGGFKNKDALKYECADMMSVGASPSVGDHLHPSGELDESTYRTVGHAFRYCRDIEKYCKDTRAHSDLAIWMSHDYNSDVGCSQALQIMHLEYDVIESREELSRYAAVILPDRVRLTEEDEAALKAYVEGGGKVIASYESAPASLGIRKLGISPYDKDYISCELGDYTTPFLSYSSAMRVEAEGEVLAEVYEPYFSRTAAHFCGHKNTPNRKEPADYPAMVRRGGVLYFAHPVFSAYHACGSYVLEQYIIKGILSVYKPSLRVEGLPSAGRVRVREARDGDFLALHLLYAPPVNRGNVCLLPDFPTLYGVKVEMDLDRDVREVFTAPDGERVEFKQENGTLSFTLPPFSLHKLVVIK